MATKFHNQSWALKAFGAVLITGFLTQASFAGGKLSRFTADFYRGQSDTYDGKEITVKVTHVKPFRFKSAIEGLRFFHAFTYDDREKIPGGVIIVAIPTGTEAEFLRKYGTAPENSGEGRKARRESDTERLTGILRADGKRLFFIDYDGQSKDIIDARRQELMKELAGAGDPDTKEPMRRGNW